MGQDAIVPPSHYIEKVSLVTGEVLGEEILPHQLLVESHRDYHLLDVYVRFLMSWMVESTGGDEELVRQTFKEVRRVGHKAADVLASAMGIEDHEKLAQRLFGLKDREYFFRFKVPRVSEEEGQRCRLAHKEAAKARFAQGGEDPQIVVFLTGGTGFVGKDVIWRLARLEAVREVFVLIRPRVVKDEKSGMVIRTVTPEQRGQALLKQLWLDGTPYASKFRFVGGDIEAPRLGLSQEDYGRLCEVTHVIHCAASVAFDAPYEESFRANVLGTRNALRFSLELQEAEASAFVAHVSIETSYIHGRQWRQSAREDEIIFPRNFYNNYYELTKAFASIEAENVMVHEGLRLIQLCPSIVVGESRTGNNRGDLKVVNAPVNAFGRAEEELHHPEKNLLARSRAWMLWQLVRAFPGDPSAQLNLVPVDRVSEGIVAALFRPDAVGERVHLATDNRITAEQIQTIMFEELGVDISLAEPTLHRNVRLPVMGSVLRGLKQEKVANALEKLANIFGGYSEWGQPIHEVGNDVALLGLCPERPQAAEVFRMLCRHNKHVQAFGRVRDPMEISRRERIWWGFIEDLEQLCGRPAGMLTHEEFQASVEMALQAESFDRVGAAKEAQLLREIEPSRLGALEADCDDVQVGDSEHVGDSEGVEQEREAEVELELGSSAFAHPPAKSEKPGATPMASVDAAWLHMEEPTNLMVVSGLLYFATPLSLATVRKVVAQRLSLYPRFTQRVVEGVEGRKAPHWEDDPTFSIEAHIVQEQLAAPGDKAQLEQRLSALLGTPLEPTRPLWQMILVQGCLGGSALLVRIHHCIADGIALIAVLLSLTGESAQASLVPPVQAAKEEEKEGLIGALFHRAEALWEGVGKKATELVHEGVETLKHPERLVEALRLGAQSVSTATHIVAQAADPPTILKGPLGQQKLAAWSEPLPLDAIKAIRRATGTTVNDVLVAVMAGALGRYLRQKQQKTQDVVIRALVPVNLRPPHEMHELGNHFGLVFLELPVGPIPPLDRLAVIKEHMNAIKRSPEAFVALGMLKALGSTPSEIQRFVLDKLSDKATAVMTNVPGPREPIYFAGEAVESMMFWVPMSARLGLGISILSYNNTVRLGINCDANLIPEPSLLMADFHREFAAMQSCIV